MTDPLLISELESALRPQLAIPPLEPSAAVDARIRRLAHAALLSSHSSARMKGWEWALSSALILSYAAYAVAQVFVAFRRD